MVSDAMTMELISVALAYVHDITTRKLPASDCFIISGAPSVGNDLVLVGVLPRISC